MCEQIPVRFHEQSHTHAHKQVHARFKFSQCMLSGHAAQTLGFKVFAPVWYLQVCIILPV